MVKNFIDISDFSKKQLNEIISLAKKIIKFHDLSYSNKLIFSNNSRKLSYFYDVLKVIDCYKKIIL